MTKDDISVGDPDEERIYQKISVRNSSGELSDSSERVSCSESEDDTRNQKIKNDPARSSRREENNVLSSKIESNLCKTFSEDIQKECSDQVNSKVNVKVEESKKCPLGKWTTNFRTFENIGNEENPPKTNDRENRGKRFPKKLSFRQSFTNYTNKGNSKNYLKLIFKKRKKEDKLENEQSPPHTVVSVVHTDNDNDVEEISLPRSICCKLSKKNSKSSFKNGLAGNQYEKSDALGNPAGVYRFSETLEKENSSRTESFLNRRIESESSTYSSRGNSYCQRTSIIPTTVELPESAPSQSYFSSEKMAYGNDKGVQVSFEDITRSQMESKEISTLDPLRPTTSSPDSPLTNCKNCQEQQRQLKLRDRSASSKHPTVRYSQSMKINRPHSFQSLVRPFPSDACSSLKWSTYKKDSNSKITNLLTPLATDDDSENSDCQQTDRTAVCNKKDPKIKQENGEDKEHKSYLSNLRFYSTNSKNPDSFVYVYQSPKSSDRSSALSSQDYKDRTYLKKRSQDNLQAKKNRRGGSSGLGSSGSDSSFEDEYQNKGAIAGGVLTAVAHSPTTKNTSAEAYSDPVTSSCCYSYSTSSLQSVGCESPLSSLSSLKSSRGRHLFDYSWNWNRLNDLVRRSPSLPSVEPRMTSSLTGISSIRIPSSFLELSFPLHQYTKKSLVI